MKKITTGKVLYVLILLGIISALGAGFKVYWLSLPFLFFLSGVVVGNLNETDVTK